MEEHTRGQEDILISMRAKAQLMEDDLVSECVAEYESTGRLSSSKLCEKSTQYENYLLSIAQMEKQLSEQNYKE